VSVAEGLGHAADILIALSFVASADGFGREHLAMEFHALGVKRVSGKREGPNMSGKE